MNIVRAEDLEARGIRCDTMTELIVQGKILLRGPTFSKLYRQNAIDLCLQQRQAGLACVLVEDKVGFTVWSENPAFTPSPSPSNRQDATTPIPLSLSDTAFPPTATPAPPPADPPKPKSRPAPKTVATYRGRPVAGPISKAQLLQESNPPLIDPPSQIPSQNSDPSASHPSAPTTTGSPESPSSGLFERFRRSGGSKVPSESSGSRPSNPTESRSTLELKYRGVNLGSTQAASPSSDLYRDFFETSAEGLFQAASDGRYLSVNPALAEIYGYPSPEEVINQLIYPDPKLYTDPTCPAELLHRLQTQGSVSNFCSQIKRNNGSTIWITEQVRAVRDKAGRLISYVGRVQISGTNQPQQDVLLGGHYRLLHPIGSGGFGQAYLAEDIHRPNNPICVVKELIVGADDPEFLATARRLFNTEAEILEQIGRHEQIPQLLAYFEQDQRFYLVQEFIEGHLLSDELKEGVKLSETEVIALLKGILTILDFVHKQNVIHRDIKPSNIIRRDQDHKLVLIDFGAVKQIGSEIATGKHHRTTIVVGTPGYMPIEQSGGRPRITSDIYAAGIVAIQALTGILPDQLERDPETEEIVWRNQSTASPAFGEIIDRMVRYHFAARYPSAATVLQALRSLRPTQV